MKDLPLPNELSDAHFELLLARTYALQCRLEFRRAEKKMFEAHYILRKLEAGKSPAIAKSTSPSAR